MICIRMHDSQMLLVLCEAATKKRAQRARKTFCYLLTVYSLMHAAKCCFRWAMRPEGTECPAWDSSQDC
jgi:hypothetical protein